MTDENENELVERLRQHVKKWGGPTLEGGAWQMMLDAADAIERLHQVRPGDRLPGGLVVVPYEPTAAMFREGCASLILQSQRTQTSAKLVYQAMLDAAKGE